MQKMHALNSAIINCMAFDYFYTKEKPDPNGNPRYKVYIMDPDAPAVYETIAKCYECQIKDHVTSFIETAVNVCS